MSYYSPSSRLSKEVKMIEVFPLFSKVTVDGVQDGIVTCVKLFPKNAVVYDVNYWGKGSLVCVTVEGERVVSAVEPVKIGFK